MFAGLHRQARAAYQRAGMLFKLHLDLLYQCDLDCAHCYLDDKSRPILPIAFWTDVLDQAAALGVFSITLSGGEIFLRKDLLALIAHARRHGLFVHLKSHGGHIDAAVARELAALGVSTVALSYYATRPAIHDAITRRPGSHEKTRAALAHLAQAGVITVATCVVMRENADEWRAVVAECEALGVFVNLEGQLNTALSGDRFPLALAVTEEARVDLERHQLEHAPAECDGPDALDLVQRDGAWETRKSCGAGHTSLYVSPEGDVTPCVRWPMPLGNLRETPLAELWRAPAASPLAAVRAITKGDRALCLTCEVREHCDFCAGQSWVETRTPTAALRHFCEKTRAKTLARAAHLGLPEPPMPAGLLDLTDPAAPARPRFVVRAAPRS